MTVFNSTKSSTFVILEVYIYISKIDAKSSKENANTGVYIIKPKYVKLSSSEINWKDTLFDRIKWRERDMKRLEVLKGEMRNDPNHPKPIKIHSRFCTTIGLSIHFCETSKCQAHQPLRVAVIFIAHLPSTNNHTCKMQISKWKALNAHKMFVHAQRTCLWRSTVIQLRIISCC